MANKGVNVRLKLSKVEIDQIRATEPGSTIYQAHERAAERLVAEAKEQAPKRSGKMAAAIDYEIRGLGRGLSAIVGVGETGADPDPADYALFVTNGTSGPIYPTDSPVLVILDGRGPVYHKSVSGQAANPFLARALAKMRDADWSE